MFCIEISINYLIDCILVALIDANGASDSGLDMSSIRSSAALVASSWLDITGILLCSGGNSTLSVIHSDKVLFV